MGSDYNQLLDGLKSMEKKWFFIPNVHNSIAIDFFTVKIKEINIFASWLKHFNRDSNIKKVESNR